MLQCPCALRKFSRVQASGFSAVLSGLYLGRAVLKKLQNTRVLIGLEHHVGRSLRMYQDVCHGTLVGKHCSTIYTWDCLAAHLYAAKQSQVCREFFKT